MCHKITYWYLAVTTALLCMETLDTMEVLTCENASWRQTDPMQEKSEHNPRMLPFTKLWIFQIYFKSPVYLAPKLVPSLTGLRTADSIGKQEFVRLLQNFNWTLHCCVKAVSFANRQIETQIVTVKQVYVLLLTITIVCFLMRIIRVSENNTTLPSELNSLERLSHRPLSLLVSPLHPILQLPFKVPKHIYNYSLICLSCLIHYVN